MVFFIVPLGAMYGFAEILFGYSLQLLLGHYGLIQPGHAPQIISQAFALSPIGFILTATLGLNVLRFLSTLMPALALEACIDFLRRSVLSRSIGAENEIEMLTVSQVSNLMANVLPKTASFFFSLTQLVMGLLTLGIIAAGMVNFSAQLTGIVIGLGVLLMAPSFVAKRLPGRYSEAYYRVLAHLTADIVRAFRNTLFIRLSGVAQRESERLAQLSRKTYGLNKMNALIFNLLSVWPYFVGITLIVALLEGNDRLRAMDQAAILPFTYLLVRFAGGISGLLQAAMGARQNVPFLREFLAIHHRLEEQRQGHGGAGGGKTAISGTCLEVHDVLTVRVSPQSPRLNFSLRSGQTLLIGGASGTGKTTLLMTILGVLPPSHGRVLWDGHALGELDSASFRRVVGYAGADPFLLDDSVRANLLFGHAGPEVDDAEIRTALTCACCDFVADLPGGLDHILREGGEGISAGQKQRLAIARALLRRPAVLILDEATANIDEPTEARIMTGIRQMLPAIMIIAVSHRSSLAGFANCKLDLGCV